MKKVPVIILLLLLLGPGLNAMRPRLSYGLEWGYTGTFLNTWQYNYIYSSGSRIIENDYNLWYYSNGFLLANAGLDLSQTVNMSLYSGIHGVYFKRRMVPVELRARWCPGGLQDSGLVTYCGVAAMFPTAPEYQTDARLNLGGGYRVNIYKSTCIDFLLSIAVSTDHKSILDPDTSLPVPGEDITKNFAQYWSASLSLAINF